MKLKRRSRHKRPCSGNYGLEDVAWNRSKAGSENLPNDVMDADIVVKTERKKGAGSSEGRWVFQPKQQKSMNQGIQPPTGEGQRKRFRKRLELCC
jgi:hypothetical protein